MSQPRFSSFSFFFLLSHFTSLLFIRKTGRFFFVALYFFFFFFFFLSRYAAIFSAMPPRHGRSRHAARDAADARRITRPLLSRLPMPYYIHA
jgi:hypothetical protein